MVAVGIKHERDTVLCILASNLAKRNETAAHKSDHAMVHIKLEASIGYGKVWQLTCLEGGCSVIKSHLSKQTTGHVHLTLR